MIKRIILALTIFISSFFLISCNNNSQADITTTLYPSYDIAKNIVGDKMTVNLLVKPGSEVHDYIPSSRQIASIKKSKLFIFTSYEMDLWLNNNEKSILGENTKTINLSLGVGSQIEIDDDLHDHDDHDHDLHFWTSPIIFTNLISHVLETIIEIDPDNRSYYQNNANIYSTKIINLMFEMTNEFHNLDQTTIYFAGHNAMQFFANDFQLNIVSLSNTNKPDADFSLSQILTLLEEIKQNNITYLFTEELKEPKIALALKAELAKENIELTLLELHGYHNLSKTDFDNNITYYDLMVRNYDNIKKALGV